MEERNDDMSTVRDRFWLWGHEAGAHNRHWGLPADSSISPGQAAALVGIPNVIMVRYGDAFDAEHAVADLRAVKQVVWSIVGGGGHTDGHEIAFVREHAPREAHWSGVMMDDFFRRPDPGDPRLAVHSPDDLAAIQQQLTIDGRKLDLWVVFYDHQLDLPAADHLAQCDVVTYWTWRAEDLDQLESNFQRMETLAPGRRKVLGCYMWDYGVGQPMPIAAMQRQCEQGLQWLRDGRIEGMIFLASCICDLEIETITWTRDWIATVGDDALP